MIKLKNRFCTTIEDFISIVETEEVDLNRGQHETCILAANLLRRALRAGLPKEIKISVEFRTKKGKLIDLLLLGLSEKLVPRAMVLEFKQWSKIESEGQDMFSARMWGEHDSKFQLNNPPKGNKKENCPLYQTHGYRTEIEKILGLAQVKSALVLPNLLSENAEKFIHDSLKIKNMSTEVFSLNKFDSLIKTLIEHLEKGINSSVKSPEGIAREIIQAPEIKPFVSDPKLLQSSKHNWKSNSKRHGWVGSLYQFIQDCEKNIIITTLEHNHSVPEKRAILFSSNHLAFALRRLANMNQKVSQTLGIVIEYQLSVQGGRIDAILVGDINGKKSTIGKLLAIEMKAWSNQLMNSFEAKERSVGSEVHPSEFTYTAKGWKERPSQHPVAQISEYIEDLQSEFNGDVHGLAWLHNVQDKLSGGLKKLVQVKHTQYGISTYKQSVFNIAKNRPVPLLTRSYQYSDTVNQKPDVSLEKYIQAFFEGDGISSIKINKATLDSLCKPPNLSKHAISSASRNAKYIMRNVLDRKQKKLVREIVKATFEAIKERSQGNTPKGAIFAVEGDAGTGKTFVALAAIGIVLQEMGGKGKEFPEHLGPHMISCSSAASDLLTRRCRLKADGHELPPHFIVSLQNFISTSRWYLSRLHYLKWTDPKLIPPLLLFDEAQLINVRKIKKYTYFI